MKTPTPWKQGTTAGYSANHIYDATGEAVCQVYDIPVNTRMVDVPERFADGMDCAALIVRAVNSHDRLVAALERAETLLQASYDLIDRCDFAQSTLVDYDGADCDGSCLMDDCETAIEDIRAALAAAKEK